LAGSFSAPSNRRATRESSATISEASPQRVERAQRDVAKVAERRRYEHETHGFRLRRRATDGRPPDRTARSHPRFSGIFNRVLGVLTDHERAAYVIEEFDSGRTKVDPSYARLRDRSRRRRVISTT
jgi:hypothetical protein